MSSNPAPRGTNRQIPLNFNILATMYDIEMVYNVYLKFIKPVDY